MENYVVLFGGLLAINFLFVFYLLYQYEKHKKFNVELVKFIISVSAGIQHINDQLDKVKEKTSEN